MNSHRLAYLKACEKKGIFPLPNVKNLTDLRLVLEEQADKLERLQHEDEYTLVVQDLRRRSQALSSLLFHNGVH